MGVPHSPTPPDARGAGTRGCLPLRITRLACALTLTLAFVGPTLATSSKPGGKDATAASAGEVAERQGDLRSLRAQIETLRRDMAAAEGSRKDVADQLQDAERAISSTQRELHGLTTQIGKLQATLRNLDAESRELEKGLRAQQGQLEKLLYRQYLRGNPDPLRLLLNGEDPNQSARDLRYIEAIGRTRHQLLIDIESTLQRKQALASETRQQAEQLSAAELRQQEEHSRLLAQREQRQAMLNKVADQILTQRREIGNLQRDEKRLTELIDRLARIIAARLADARANEIRETARRESAHREAQRREMARPELRQEKLPRSAAPPSETDPAAKAPAAAESRSEPAPPVAPSAGGLARQRGELRLPTRGAVANRFGSARQEGSTWKGIFIRANAGSDVRSIAGGRVVFAEWMRGFGNLMIVDHGSSYLSIYANNDALLKQVGDDVHGGDMIATVGNSGGNPESGLYFEIRHQGKPIDPLAWLNLK